LASRSLGSSDKRRYHAKGSEADFSKARGHYLQALVFNIFKDFLFDQSIQIHASAMTTITSPLPEDSLLLAELTKISEIDYEQDPTPLQRQGAEAVIDFIADFAADGLVRDKRLVALVLTRLKDLQVRDFALGSVSTENIELYFNAWHWLLRHAPQGYVAPVANLLAAVAYEKGDGGVAHRALDRAVKDDPEYAMTGLLRQVFSSGWSPSTFAVMRQELHPRICDAIFSGSINP
jgi:hypothetical protein